MSSFFQHLFQKNAVPKPLLAHAISQKNSYFVYPVLTAHGQIFIYLGFKISCIEKWLGFYSQAVWVIPTALKGNKKGNNCCLFGEIFFKITFCACASAPCRPIQGRSRSESPARAPRSCQRSCHRDRNCYW